MLGGAGVIIDSHLFGNGLIRGKDFFGSTFDSLLTKNCNIKDRKELEPFFSPSLRICAIFIWLHVTNRGRVIWGNLRTVELMSNDTKNPDWAGVRVGTAFLVLRAAD